MIEGNGSDTPEAGPSGWPLRGQTSNGELRRRYPEHNSVPEGSTSGWHLKVSGERALLYVICQVADL